MVTIRIESSSLTYDIERQARVIIQTWEEMRGRYDDPDVRVVAAIGDIQVVYDGTTDLTSLIQEMQRQQGTPAPPQGSLAAKRMILQGLIDKSTEEQAAALWPFIQEMQRQGGIVSHVFLPASPAAHLVALQELIDQLTDEEAADLLHLIRGFLDALARKWLGGP
jgi:hypothetical protein